MYDGGPCKGGICYGSWCNTHEGQCQDILGPKAKSTDEKCYLEMNTKGDHFSNSGNT